MSKLKHRTIFQSFTVAEVEHIIQRIDAVPEAAKTDVDKYLIKRFTAAKEMALKRMEKAA